MDRFGPVAAKVVSRDCSKGLRFARTARTYPVFVLYSREGKLSIAKVSHTALGSLSFTWRQPKACERVIFPTGRLFDLLVGYLICAGM